MNKKEVVEALDTIFRQVPWDNRPKARAAYEVVYQFIEAAASGNELYDPNVIEADFNEKYIHQQRNR